MSEIAEVLFWNMFPECSTFGKINTVVLLVKLLATWTFNTT
jgi:hypothetical protein